MTTVASTGFSRERPGAARVRQPRRAASPAGEGRSGGRRRRTRRADLLVQLLEHAGGVLASGHAQVQPLFLLLEDRQRIFLAARAALAAILLGHRRHHAARQRPAFRELHAVDDLDGGIVPRRAIIGRRRRARSSARRREQPRHQRRRFLRGQRRRRRVELQQAGEEAVEPGALLRAERRGLRQYFQDRRPRRQVHSPASCSNIAVSASASWRFAKARKLSCGEARWAI